MAHELPLKHYMILSFYIYGDNMPFSLSTPQMSFSLSQCHFNVILV